MKLDKKSLLLYAVTDRTWVGESTLAKQVEDAISGGATCIQLREKEMTGDEFFSEAMIIKDICKKSNVPFIINDSVDVALKCKADGIHIGQEDMSAKEVRSLIGDKMILGVSAQTVEQAVQAEKDGADYLGVGAVFPTSTKTDAVDVPHDILCKICESVNIPVVAIGGINEKNIAQLSGKGILGVALVSAIFAAEDIKASCEMLSMSVKKVVE